MLTHEEIFSAFEQWAPKNLAESYDNVGLLVGDALAECTGVLFSLDCMEAVVEEAISLGANLIISHHPIWFANRKSLTGNDYVSRTLLKAIQSNIALYALHTNLDNIPEGVNAILAEKLGLQSTQILLPRKENHADYTVTGAGMIGSLPQPLSPEAFLKHVCEKLRTPALRWSAAAHVSSIRKVAICGGSGSFLIADAQKQGADALVTGDITYHTFFDGAPTLLLIDAGHAETEQFVPELLLSYFQRNFSSFAAYLSKVPTNPVQYYIHG